MRRMDIAKEREPDYESVKIECMGLIDPYGLEGLAVLRSRGGKELHVKAFSGENARYIAYMIEDEEEANQVPSVYNMISEICENNELVLVKAKIYQSGSILRANLYFTGKKDLVLKNYRASDAIILATLYKIPILVRKNLLKEPEDIMQEIDSEPSSTS